MQASRTNNRNLISDEDAKAGRRRVLPNNQAWRSVRAYGVTGSRTSPQRRWNQQVMSTTGPLSSSAARPKRTSRRPPSGSGTCDAADQRHPSNIPSHKGVHLRTPPVHRLAAGTACSVWALADVARLGSGSAYERSSSGRVGAASVSLPRSGTLKPAARAEACTSVMPASVTARGRRRGWPVKRRVRQRDPSLRCQRGRRRRGYQRASRRRVR